jgi:hypothetical protein
MKRKSTTLVYTLLGSKKPPTWILQSRDTNSARLHHITKDNVYRPIRYSEYHKSPFLDEQEGEAKLSPIIFEDGYLVVPAHNEALINFLAAHPGNGSLFELDDPEKKAREELEYLDLEAKAMAFVKSAPIDLLASAVRILDEHSVAQTTAEIKRDAYALAKSDPEGLLSVTTDPSFEIKNVVQRVIDEGLLAFRNNKRDIHYNLPENKKRLIAVPMDETWDSALERYFLSSEGAEVYSAMKRLLEME